jgi:hypothetical protein
MTFLLPVFMEPLGPVPTKTRKLRKDAFYSPAERAILNVHRLDYRTQTTRELRANVLKTKVLPDLFNYWDQQGTGPNSEEETTARMKVIYIPSTSIMLGTD